MFPDDQSSQHRADVRVSGDPSIDPEISINIKTDIHDYNINLQRLNSSILHTDFNVLHIYTDAGKTVLHEDHSRVRLINTVCC